MSRVRLIVITGCVLIAIGITCNDWLPTGILSDVGALGNNDRRDALRVASVLLPLFGSSLIIWRAWIAASFGSLIAMFVSTVLSLAALVFVDIALTKSALQDSRTVREIVNVHTDDELLGWRPKPDVRGRHREGEDFDVSYEIDRAGYKAVDNRGVAVSRIFIFGDSYTFGHGVPNDETYPNIMAKDYLDDSVHVFNLGAMGYGMAQLFGRFLEIEAQLKANDIVIFAPTSQDLKRSYKDFVFPSKLIFGDRVEFGSHYPRYNNGVLESRLLDTSWNALKAMLFNGRWTKAVFRFAHSAIMSPPTTAEAIDMIERVNSKTQARGARFVLFFLPQTKEIVRNEYEEDVSYFAYHDIMRYFPQSESGLKTVRFETDSHWNRLGHEIAARAIVDTLLQHDEIPAALVVRDQ